MDSILTRLQKVFQRTLRQPKLTLSPEMNADDVQGWDSLANIGLIIALEKEFKIRLNTADIAGTKNIGGLGELIAQKIDKGGNRMGRVDRPVAVDKPPTPRARNLGEICLDTIQFGGKEPSVVKLFTPAGSIVEKDDPIFDVENSKATLEIVAPASGKLAHALAIGDVLPFGKVVAAILPAETSEAAISEIIEHLREAKFAIRPGQNGTDLALPESKSSHSTAGTSAMTLPPRKLEEIRVLSNGAGNTMLSVIGCRLGRLEIRRETAESFFVDKIVDFVIYEAARLLKRFPKLNAFYQDGVIHIQSRINAGIAFDEGERLVVYGLSDADKKGLQEIRFEIEDALTKYMRRELTGDQLTSATFTITDVSALNLDFSFPILPQGQACIIAITRNEEGEFALFLGYDHRVTEGLQAAKFLEDLRLRVVSFESQRVQNRIPRCSFCDKSVLDETGPWRGRGLLKILDAKGEEVLACHSCWSGW